MQITQGGVKTVPDAIERLAENFRRRTVAMVVQFLAPSVLSAVLKKGEAAELGFVKELLVTGATLFMPPGANSAFAAFHAELGRAVCDVVARTRFSSGLGAVGSTGSGVARADSCGGMVARETGLDCSAPSQIAEN